MGNLFFQILSCSFSVIVVVSNILSAKMIKLPLFSDLSIPAGIITYPLTFLISGLVTEFYGSKKARMMVYIALGMNLLSFALVQLGLALPSAATAEGEAFQAVMGLSGLRVFSSLAAYLIAQIVEIHLYAQIKLWTGKKFLWLRNNGATFVSQLVDTVVVDILFLYLGLGMGLSQVVPIIAFSYVYKIFFSAANTPLFYLCFFLIRLKKRAQEEPELAREPIG